MPYTEINWPVDPFVGQVYVSSFGRKWLWNGCAWTATCCPPCNPGDGLDLVMSFGDNPGVYFNTAFQFTGTDVNGYPQYGFTVISGVDWTISYNILSSRWEIYLDTQFLAWSNTIYGSYGTEWNQGDPSSLNYLTTKCGATFPILCLNIDGVQSNLLASGSLPGETSEFATVDGGIIMWDGSQWTGAVGSGGSTLITLAGSASIPPSGTWTIVDPGSPPVSSVVTSLGSCTFV